MMPCFPKTWNVKAVGSQFKGQTSICSDPVSKPSIQISEHHKVHIIIQISYFHILLKITLHRKSTGI